MALKPLFLLLLFFFKAISKPTYGNVTVIGSVFCDSCSDITFSKRSYFLQGTRVMIQCKFKGNTISVNETTDQYGVYKIDIPSIYGFKCKQSRKKSSPCQASLIESSSSLCNLTAICKSTTLVATKSKNEKLCILNLNAMSYKPPKRDVGYCGPRNKPLLSSSTNIDSSTFLFWPLVPPFLLPWLHWPPLPFALPPLPFPFNLIPLPDPSNLPFSLIPPWLLPFLNPSSLPFPFSLIPPLIPPAPTPANQP